MFKDNDKRQLWVPCPRCINGNMYEESDGEYVCLQCGYIGPPNLLPLYRTAGSSRQIR